MSKIKICISIDWEGEDISQWKLLKKFRERLPVNIPLCHFICPAYFIEATKPSSLDEIILDSDEVALHLHPTKKLVQQAGISFRTDKNFYRPEHSLLPKWLAQYLPVKAQEWFKLPVSGRGVPISVYLYDELEQLISHSLQLLKANFPQHTIKGFRAGGCMTNDLVFDALQKLGFQYDSSAFPPEILSQNYSIDCTGSLEDDYGDKNGLYTQYILDLWGAHQQTEGFLSNQYFKEVHHKPISRSSQSFYVKDILEIPINCGMADFASFEKTWEPTLIKSKKILESSGKGSLLMLGIHQEGNWDYKKAMIRFIEYAFCHFGDYIEFVTPSKYLATQKEHTGIN